MRTADGVVAARARNRTGGEGRDVGSLEGAVAPVDGAEEVAGGRIQVGVGEGGGEAGGAHALDAARGADRARRQGRVGDRDRAGVAGAAAAVVVDGDRDA